MRTSGEKILSLLQPISLGELQIKNRIVFPPYFSNTASETGEASPELVARYAALAESTGLIIVEQAFVSQDGRAQIRQLDVSNDHNISSLKKLTDAVHQKGAKLAS